MRKVRYLRVGLISFFVFSFLSAPIMGSTTAVAVEKQSVAPEGASNGHKVYDPNEQFNRGVFEFNDHLYFYVLKPVAEGYSVIFPLEVREAIRNGFHNLVFPSRFINLVLQGKLDKAGNEVLRFIINSGLGLAGMVDVAQCGLHLNNNEADFGQTLGIWGACPGPYMVIPVLGPSNPRDLLGFGVDTTMDPLFWLPVQWWVSFSAQTGKYVNRTSLRIGEYEELKKASLDPYIAMRDAYIQYREHFVSK